MTHPIQSSADICSAFLQKGHHSLENKTSAELIRRIRRIRRMRFFERHGWAAARSPSHGMLGEQLFNLTGFEDFYLNDTPDPLSTYGIPQYSTIFHNWETHIIRCEYYLYSTYTYIYYNTYYNIYNITTYYNMSS